MIDGLFGKPELAGVVLSEEPDAPKTRMVRVHGRITVEYWVDEVIEVDNGMSDREIRDAAVEAAGIPGGDIEHIDLNIDDTERRKSAQAEREQRARERALLEAWHRGEPIRA